jgi:DNA-binding SARP family transcriptional activator
MDARNVPRPRDRPPAVLHVLDGPYLRVRGQPAVLPESSLRLLVYLAFRRRPAARRVVAATLWPEVGEARAGGNLRSAVWRLRGAGADGAVVESSGTTLTLGPDVGVDLEALSGWAERIIGGDPGPAGRTDFDDLTGPRFPAAPADLADLAVPDGVDAALDLLPGWYDDWVIAERERLRTRVLHALEQLSRHLSAAGRHAQAVDAAIAAVCAEPLRESAQRTLIRAHLAEGNLVEAQRTFRTYRQLLAVELGVDPAPELWQLIAAARIGHLPGLAVR